MRALTTIPSLPFDTSVLDVLAEGVYIVDAERRILYWNRAAERITGFSACEVLGRRCMDDILTHVDCDGENLCQKRCPLAATLHDGQDRQAQVFLHHKRGHRVPVSAVVSRVLAPDGTVLGAVESFRDNSQLVSALERVRTLERSTMIDPLTNLGNRRALSVELGNRLGEYTRYGWPFAVLFLDIDRFKAINDRHGHQMGDRVLVMVADTIASNLRAFDFAGRWGGEELMVCLPHVSDVAELHQVAERLRALIAGAYMVTPEGSLRATVSIGATIVRPGDTLDSLVDRADSHMYAAKQAGRDRVEVDRFTPPLPARRACHLAPEDTGSVEGAHARRLAQ